MLYFLLSVLFTVALYLILRSYPRFGVNSLHAVVLNYYACVVTGLLLTPDLAVFDQVNWSSTGSLLTLSLGILFVTAFMLIGLTAQKVSVTASSLSANMSLIIPVFFGIFIFQNNNKAFTALNYSGLLMAFVALALGAIQQRPKENSADIMPKLGSIWPLPLLTFIASGINNTLINFLSSQYYSSDQATIFMIIACIGAALIGSILLFYKYINAGELLSAKSIVGGLLLGVPNFLSLYFLLKALSVFGNSAAFVFPVYNILTMLVSSLAAWLIFKEKLNNINRLGLALAIVAVILISYQELGFGK